MPGLNHAIRVFRFASALLTGLALLVAPGRAWTSELPEPRNDRQAILVGAISPSSLEHIRFNAESSARATVVVRALYSYRNGCHGYQEEYRAVVKGGGFTIANVPLCGGYAVWKIIVEPESRQRPIVYTNASIDEGMRYWQARGQSWDDPVIILGGSVIDEENTFSINPDPSTAQIASLFRYLAEFRGSDHWLSDTTEELARQGGDFSLNEVEDLAAAGEPDESSPPVPVVMEGGAIGPVIPAAEGASVPSDQRPMQDPAQELRPTIELLPCVKVHLGDEPRDVPVYQVEFLESVYLACRVEDLESAGVGRSELTRMYFTLGNQYPEFQWIGSLEGLAELAEFTCYLIENSGEVLVCP